MWTDNPVRDAERYFASQDEEEARTIYPTCEECGKEITDDELYYIFDCTLCYDCVFDCRRDTVDFIRHKGR